MFPCIFSKNKLDRHVDHFKIKRGSMLNDEIWISTCLENVFQKFQKVFQKFPRHFSQFPRNASTKKHPRKRPASDRDIIKTDYLLQKNASSKLRPTPQHREFAREKLYDAHDSSQDHGKWAVNRSIERSHPDLQNEPNIYLPS
jgi:hypothetical protein